MNGGAAAIPGVKRESREARARSVVPDTISTSSPIAANVVTLTRLVGREDDRYGTGTGQANTPAARELPESLGRRYTVSSLSDGLGGACCA
jgi:hypothetical protein